MMDLGSWIFHMSSFFQQELDRRSIVFYYPSISVSVLNHLAQHIQDESPDGRMAAVHTGSTYVQRKENFVLEWRTAMG